ncbi:response regulator transcription factor [Lacihabitans sp. CS3-21]|jgi:two-component system alkaline phosphatase synthesis response regulator PhoP|uniref:response regulator transcription factor n=1 Tax=Lacihabitans sp. CS3-21 TaxID=2487332 RepID=UPI000BC462E6|nr:response regulator transcription factor [Lacihabitans sp. CS3-21]MCP9748042.1 DNA-binding response regulator [Lacihabitans sp. CS3-21]MDP1817008.1 response regulator transcription factor [Leadbetterella sp.]OYU93471.1 MAG: DNA-binding response regulator [Bacteroidetes bacterium B1(2017)]
MAKKVLVIDDDADILELLIYNLEKEGYEVKSAANGLEGIEAAKQFMPDLILMDIMMPIMDGIEAGKIIKSTEKLKHIHLLYLTARAEEYSEVAAFEVGADDYLTKPIKPRALLSRINAFFRKETQKSSDEGVLHIAGLTINKETYSVTKEDGSVVVLPKKEFEILHYLATVPNKVQSRESLLQKIWGSDVFVVERTIDVHIRKVREKIGDQYIGTLKGVGYMFKTDN